MFDGAVSKYRKDGYCVIPGLVRAADLTILQKRVDDVMDGLIRYPSMEFQADTSTGNYSDLKHGNTDWVGPTRNYRKIKGWEADPLFLSVFRSAPIKALSEEFIGPRVATMRALLMNKPATGGTMLPWHQDVSADWPMTAMPTMTVWIALDAATKESGTLEVAVGSHKHGRIGKGHYLSPEEEAKFIPDESRLLVEIAAGDAIVFDCALVHRSSVNKSNQPRRAMTLCLMDADIRNTRTNQTYPIIFDGN